MPDPTPTPTPQPNVSNPLLQVALLLIVAVVSAVGGSCIPKIVPQPNIVVPPSPVVPPTPSPKIIPDANAKWYITKDGLGVDAPAVVDVLKNGVGVYTAHSYVVGEEIQTYTVTVAAGILPTPPVPVPPTPVPPTPPTPTPTTGPKTVVLFYESGETTPELSLLIQRLQDGQATSDLLKAGHKLLAMDLDIPTQVVKDWKAQLGDTKFPAICILDPKASNKVLFKETLPNDTKISGLLETLKKNGVVAP